MVAQTFLQSAADIKNTGSFSTYSQLLEPGHLSLIIPAAHLLAPPKPSAAAHVPVEFTVPSSSQFPGFSQLNASGLRGRQSSIGLQSLTTRANFPVSKLVQKTWLYLYTFRQIVKYIMSTIDADKTHPLHHLIETIA